ncbi:MAG: hypothetical protein M3415_00860 [Actinomycetota bacterium]|nr:hypothetical protein [Actinomycetota bacterium]
MDNHRPGAAGRRGAARTGVALLAMVLCGVIGSLTMSVPRPLPTVAGVDETGLRLPPRGSVSAQFLDSRPVFVVHDQNGGVSVLDARSPHLVGRKLLAWCEDGRAFIDVQHGSAFDEHGRYTFGPAPRGMASYDVVALPAGAVTAGARRPGPPRGSETDSSSPAACWPEDGSPLSPDEYLAHHSGIDAATPEQAVMAGNARGLVVDGLLERIGDLPPRLCGDAPPRGLPRCPSDAPIVTEERAIDPEADSYQQSEGRFVIDVAAGRVTALTYTPMVLAERSGYFRGRSRYRGALHLPGAYDEEGFMSVGQAPGRAGVNEALWLRSYTGPTTVGTFTDDTAAVHIPNPDSVSVRAQRADGSTVTTLAQLRNALRAGSLASTSFTVAVDKRTQAVVALRQQR